MTSTAALVPEQNVRDEAAVDDSATSAVARTDINVAAALRAQYAIQTPRLPRRRQKRRNNKVSEGEEEIPVIDTTTTLPLHSKKTDRLQKRHQKKTQKAAEVSAATTYLSDLPTELLTEILGWLGVADIFSFSRVSKDFRDLVYAHEKPLADNLIRRRYWTLHRCFPLPVPLNEVPHEYHDGLLSDKRQEMLNIHRKSYAQHVEIIDPHAVCTCMTCVFAWNNLCLLIDLHHWQHNLATREPIPIIPRGTNPEWNQKLLKHNADMVRRAIRQPLYYAAILDKHLSTISGTILRFAKWKQKGATAARPRLYHMTDWDLKKGTDEFLDRSGPPSYDFPFHRDNYYGIEAYLPNRKWGEDGQWHYYPLPPTQHLRDLEYVKTVFKSTIPPEQRRTQALANLKDHNIRWSQYLEQLDHV